jgi:hypothetical protein
VIVTVAVAGFAELFAVSVIALVPAVLEGLNVADTPAGNPEAVRLTFSLKPLLGSTVIFVEPLFPCVKERLAAAGESTKSLALVGWAGNTSYNGCAGFTSGFSSATEIARIRTLLLSGSFIVFVPAGRSIRYTNKYE